MTPDFRFLVLWLKIHCWAEGSHRNAVSGVVEYTASSTPPAPSVFDHRTGAPARPAVPTETPEASQTRNLTGTVLPCLNTLLPSALTGWRTTPLGDPRQVAVE